MSNLSMEPGQSRITGDWRLDDPIRGGNELNLIIYIIYWICRTLRLKYKYRVGDWA